MYWTERVTDGGHVLRSLEKLRGGGTTHFHPVKYGPPSPVLVRLSGDLFGTNRPSSVGSVREVTSPTSADVDRQWNEAADVDGCHFRRTVPSVRVAERQGL